MSSGSGGLEPVRSLKKQLFSMFTPVQVLLHRHAESGIKLSQNDCLLVDGHSSNIRLMRGRGFVVVGLK